MLTASTNLMQEEWVQRWLHKLTPQQKVLVIEVLENSNKYWRATQTAVAPADVLAMVAIASDQATRRG